MIAMIADKPGQARTGRELSVGTTVEYLGHVPGGMVRVRFPDDTYEIVHPGCFAEFRDRGTAPLRKDDER